MLNGQRGSSACTIICILLAEMASESPVLSLPHFQNLSKNWYFATSEAILKRNSIYDKHIASPGTRLDVEEVKHLPI